jgi:hypothetical protein
MGQPTAFCQHASHVSEVKKQGPGSRETSEVRSDSFQMHQLHSNSTITSKTVMQGPGAGAVAHT